MNDDDVETQQSGSPFPAIINALGTKPMSFDEDEVNSFDFKVIAAAAAEA